MRPLLARSALPRMVRSAIFSRSTSAMNARAARMKRPAAVSSKRSVTDSIVTLAESNLSNRIPMWFWLRDRRSTAYATIALASPCRRAVPSSVSPPRSSSAPANCRRFGGWLVDVATHLLARSYESPARPRLPVSGAAVRVRPRPAGRGPEQAPRRSRRNLRRGASRRARGGGETPPRPRPRRQRLARRVLRGVSSERMNGSHKLTGSRQILIDRSH